MTEDVKLSGKIQQRERLAAVEDLCVSILT